MTTRSPENSRMRGLLLVAGREIRVRGLSKANLISMASTVVITGVLAALPTLLDSGDGDTEIGLAGAAAPAMEQQLEAMDGYEVTVYDSVDEAEQAVEDGDVEAAVADGGLYSDGSPAIELQAVLESAWQAAAVHTNLTDAGLSEQEIGQALSTEPLEMINVSDSDSDSLIDYFTGLLITLLMFMMLILPVQYIAMGVVEEKSSRIVEILLTSLRPWQLLGGKVIGLGMVALVNLVAVIAVGLGVAAGTGLLQDLPEGTVSAALSTVGWWLIAFALFGTLAGGVGSLVSRQEDAGSVQTPLILALTLSYVGSIFMLNAPGSTAAQVLSIVPPFSAIAMPTRMVLESVPFWEIGLSIALLLAAAVGALSLGAKIYSRSVLYTGSRLKLSEALRRAA